MGIKEVLGVWHCAPQWSLWSGQWIWAYKKSGEGLFTRASRDQTNLLTRPECEVDYVAEAKGSCRKAAGVTAWWLS